MILRNSLMAAGLLAVALATSCKPSQEGGGTGGHGGSISPSTSSAGGAVASSGATGSTASSAGSGGGSATGTGGMMGTGGAVATSSTGSGGATSSSSGGPCDFTAQWLESYDGAPEPAQYPVPTQFEVVVDASDDVLLLGSFAGTVDLGGGPLTAPAAKSLFVAKLDPAGHHLWSKAFPGDRGRLGADAAGNVYVVDAFSGTFDFGGGPISSSGGDVVLKLAPAGTFVWAAPFTQSHVDTMAVDPAGDVVLGGSILGSSASFLDYVVTKLTSSGAVAWSHTYPQAGVFSAGLRTDSDGSVYLVAESRGDQPQLGGQAWVIDKWDAAGTKVWTSSAATPPSGTTIHSAAEKAVAVDAEGNLYWTFWAYGDNYGSVFFDNTCKFDFSSGTGDTSALVKLDKATGKCVWLRTFTNYSDPWNDLGPMLILDATGSPVVANGMLHLQRWTADGSLVQPACEATFPTPSDPFDRHRGIARSAAGKPLLAGTFHGSLTYPPITAQAGNVNDFFIVKF